MRPITPIYRLRQDYRLEAQADGASALSAWNDSIRHQSLQNACAVNMIDWHPIEAQSGMVEGPATLSISLFLKGRGRFSVQGGAAVDLADRSLLLFHSRRLARGHNSIEAGHRLLGVDFRFEPGALERMGLIDQDRIGGIDLPKDTPLLLRLPLSVELTKIAQETVNCTLRGLAREVYLGAKALEVLAYVISRQDHPTDAGHEFALRDRLLIRLASEIIATRFDEPWTISRLARETGLNERKLKRGFRALLGITVHGYLERARIEAAAGMLAAGNTTVTDTAIAVGYANPSHFAKVFFRRKGMQPNLWQRRYGR